MDTEKQAVKKAISTGNDELDKKLGGGIPLGTLTLVEGEPDSGKSVLTQQLLWGSLHHGCTAMIFTTESTMRSLVSQMDSLNLGILDHLLLSRLRIYPIDAKKTRRSLTHGLMPLLNYCATRGTDLAVVDSITYYLTHASMEEVITFFEDCKALTGMGMSVMCIAHSYAFDQNVMIRLGSMCDCHLKLRIETMGAKMVKMLEVLKVRGAQQKTGNIVSFDVEPGLGMKVIPYSKAQA